MARPVCTVCLLVPVTYLQVSMTSTSSGPKQSGTLTPRPYERDKKIGHRRVNEAGQVTYKKVSVWTVWCAGPMHKAYAQGLCVWPMRNACDLCINLCEWPICRACANGLCSGLCE